jgi:hypothetical protein
VGSTSEEGTQAVAASVQKRTAKGSAVLLYNRRMPGGRGDIDLIGIAPRGVFVADVENDKGKAHVVNGQDPTTFGDGLDRQVAAVRAALGRSGFNEVPVQGVVCVAKADRPLIGTSRMRGHLLLYPRGLARRMNADGPLSPAMIAEVAGRLAAALPRA